MNSSISLGFVCFDFTNVINIYKVSKTERYTIYILSELYLNAILMLYHNWYAYNCKHFHHTVNC